MNYNKMTVRDVQLSGKKVLLRCDFNVPQDKTTGEITSDKRIVAALPTIRYLLDNGAAVIACSHLGKPKGTWKESLTLAPVAKRLTELLGMDVLFAKDIIGEDAKTKAAALQPGQLLLLENLRFDPREEKNDPEFAKELASMAELYVSDAFGTVHRAHASTAGVAAYLPAYAGLLIEKELSVMGKALEDPKRPFVAILGGAKVSDKIGVINNLLEKADTIIIGGGMAYTFVKAQGGEIGTSLLEADKMDYALEMIQKAKDRGVKLLLPIDTMAGDQFAADVVVVAGDGDGAFRRDAHGFHTFHGFQLVDVEIADGDGIRFVDFLIAEAIDVRGGGIVGATEHGGHLSGERIAHGVAEQEGAGDERRANHDGDACGYEHALGFSHEFQSDGPHG